MLVMSYDQASDWLFAFETLRQKTKIQLDQIQLLLQVVNSDWIVLLSSGSGPLGCEGADGLNKGPNSGAKYYPIKTKISEGGVGPGPTPFTPLKVKVNLLYYSNIELA